MTNEDENEDEEWRERGFAHYLDTALGSAYEVETQLLIANKIGYIDNEKYKELHNGIINIEKQLAGLIRSLRQ